jgi:ferredoxin
MRTFVTGSTGLLGNNLVRTLLDAGHEGWVLARSKEKATVECIDCGACVPACPACAIFVIDDLPAGEAVRRNERQLGTGGKFTPNEYAEHGLNAMQSTKQAATHAVSLFPMRGSGNNKRHSHLPLLF